MSLPKHEVIIGKDGLIHVEGLEHNGQCFKLDEIAKTLGKVVSEEKKEHVPVYNDVHQRSL
ncbi:MAG: hypothetical protein IMZ64_14015 [Bacteroidetes bacterium]|nr:hypothetical protein [Bacteroidota bacterium]